MIPIYLVTESSFQKRVVKARIQKLAEVQGFLGKNKEVLFCTGTSGALEAVYFGMDPKSDSFWDIATLAQRAPEGTYEIKTPLPNKMVDRLCFAWHACDYQFNAFKTKSIPKKVKTLHWPKNANKERVAAWLEGMTLVRDMINMPPNVMTPLKMRDIAQEIAQKYHADFKIYEGAQLEKEFPLVHAVGKGSAEPSFVIELKWHAERRPLLGLVGKGVTFDTGGLNLKPGNHMMLMKKDMGGAAHMLALAQMIMRLKLPIGIHLMMPCVENNINGQSMRPSDIYTSRKGLTVEVLDTDAEGRLILADALTAVSASQPDLLVDYATLTGSARVALGPEVPALFCNDEKWQNRLMRTGKEEEDPVWPLPLWQPYVEDLKSSIADVQSVAKGSYGDAIMAGLFMEKFLEPKCPWIHIDMIAWNPKSRPGRPEGGEMMTLRALLSMIEKSLR